MDLDNILHIDVGIYPTETDSQTRASSKFQDSFVHNSKTAYEMLKDCNTRDMMVAEVQSELEEMQRKEREIKERMAEINDQLSELDDTYSFAEAEYEDDQCSDCTDNDFSNDILDEEDIDVEITGFKEGENDTVVKMLIAEIKGCTKAAGVLCQALTQGDVQGKVQINVQDKTVTETQNTTEVAAQLVEAKKEVKLTKKEQKKLMKESKIKEKEERKRLKKEAKLQKKERKLEEKHRNTTNRKERYIYQENGEDTDEIVTKPRGFGERARRFFGRIFCFN